MISPSANELRISLHKQLAPNSKSTFIEEYEERQAEQKQQEHEIRCTVRELLAHQPKLDIPYDSIYDVVKSLYSLGYRKMQDVANKIIRAILFTADTGIIDDKPSLIINEEAIRKAAAEYDIKL